MKYEFMSMALKEAEKAFDNNEVPVGAVIVKNNKIISCGYNQKEKNNSVLSHAELNCINVASNKLNNWRLDDCELYVSLDPCPMCASAIRQARIKKVYAALSNDDINYKIINDIFSSKSINPTVEFVSNLAPVESKKIITNFFKIQRNIK